MLAGLGQDFLRTASAVFVLSGYFQRTRWKYHARHYRYVCWEAGHIAQNLYLAGEAAGLGVCVVGAFFDDALNDLLRAGRERGGSARVHRHRAPLRLGALHTVAGRSSAVGFLLPGDGRDEARRLDRHDGTADLGQEAFGGVAHQEPAQSGPGHRSEDQQIDLISIDEIPDDIGR